MLVAVAHAQSRIKNDRDGITKRIGPFRFSKETWKTLIVANPAIEVRIDDVGDWRMQVLIATLAFRHYRKMLKAALEPAEPNALQLYTAHVLGTYAASVIAKADVNKQLLEVLPEAGLDQAAIDFALKLLPAGKTSVANLNQVLHDELQQGIVIGAAIGAVLGALAGFLFTRNYEQLTEGEEIQALSLRSVPAGDMVKLFIAILGVLRGIAELGERL